MACLCWRRSPWNKYFGGCDFVQNQLEFHLDFLPLLSVLADLAETGAPSSEQPPGALLGQIQALAAQLSSEDLQGYSGRQLFQMQEQLAGMASCILRNLQARWPCPE